MSGTVARQSHRTAESRRELERMAVDLLTPLRLRPLFKPAIWGGTRLRPWLGETPSNEPTGEAWVLSDHGDSHSEIIEGSAAGKTLRQLMERMPERLLGQSFATTKRFPLLLKFIDARLPLSVQVHPDDSRAKHHEPHGPGIGKTEAWVMLAAEPDARLYAGLVPGATTAQLREAIAVGHLEPLLHVMTPKPGDCLFLKAGTVHAIGAGTMLFEIQQSSDITYRLFDWNRVDPKTGKARDLHVEKGLACVDDTLGPCVPVFPLPHPARETLIDGEYFSLDRWNTDQLFRVGRVGECRMIVGLEGLAEMAWDDRTFAVRPGDVWLIPAETGVCEVIPRGPVTLLECGCGQNPDN
ncbi:type I phosphomannose isomerase catalytic subunit [Zavarzinella formosa]|uniref:type I phosphomannose isomerase catalytic subunit n=1 Tax=Zavarzinella formosa TaxID=360055 RepID=UPI00037312C6|nr:type I phosphomannose isomerase catalytic subunit [Zavarzinella formosa]